MKKIYTATLFLFLAITAFSQNETNNWVFGDKNWIDFNATPAEVQNISGGNFTAIRNSVSISDKDGNLLFTSDGGFVYDRNHNEMPNGAIDASILNTHPVFAFPKPNSDHLYYLIYNTFESPFPRLKWAVIDMTLNNGLGDIIDDPNNSGLLLNNPSGKITTVLHDNLIDVWVISHKMDSDEYYAWLATATGISETPVVSEIGSVIINGFMDNGNGQIKTSPDGKKIGAVNRGNNKVEVFDFDRATGEFSNEITLNPFFGPYGLEFSPSGQYLYTTHEGFQGDSRVLQFDLWAGNQFSIQISEISIGNPPILGNAGGLQLASDGKIYCVSPGHDALAIIHNPDSDGWGCNFEQEALFGLSNSNFFSLPSFPHHYFDKRLFSYDGVCSGGATTFEIDGFDGDITSVLWDFGDPSSGANNTSTNLTPSHDYPSSGSYYVRLTINSNGETFTDKILIHIAPTEINLGADSTLCSNQVLTIDAYTPNAEYLWSNNATTSALGINSPGTYSITVTVDDCPALIDEITINHIPAPDADLGGNGALCNGVPTVLDATNPNATYQWSTGSTTSMITSFFGGFYSVTVTNPNGCTDTDEVLYIVDEVSVNPSQANLKCFNDSSGVALVFPTNGQLPFTYLWSNGDTLYTTNHLSASNYTVTITDIFGCTEIQNFILTEPSELLVNVTTNEDNPATGGFEGSVLLQPSGGNPPYTFDWENLGTLTDPLVEGLENGIYNITITDDNGCEKIVAANVGDVTSIEEISFLEKTKLFPNPTNDFLFVKIPTTQNEDLKISTFNTLGQPIGEVYIYEKGKLEFSIDVNNWPSGIYFLKIKSDIEERIWKFNVVK